MLTLHSYSCGFLFKWILFFLFARTCLRYGLYISASLHHIYTPVEVKRFYRIPKRFTSLCCIYILRLKRSGFRSALLIVEVRLEGVFPAILLHYHTLVF